MPVLMGCIADDFTGATDLANELQRQGMRTILFLNNEYTPVDLSDIDCVVVALKIRTAPVEYAVTQALVAMKWLQEQSCQFYYFKYCSTFDSTKQGNIGPIADALLDALGEPFTISSPAFPRTGRTVYKSHLFVGDKLLSDTHMRHHPLTPMTESNLAKWLGKQTKGRVGVIDRDTIQKGEAAIVEAIQNARKENLRYAIVDAIVDSDLIEIGRAATKELKLLTGASGVAYGVARVLIGNDLSLKLPEIATLPNVNGAAAVLAGSCSKATLGQIEYMKNEHPCFSVDVALLAEGNDIVSEAIEWAKPYLGRQPVLIYSSVLPDRLQEIQSAIGVEKACALTEQTMTNIAKQLIKAGVRQLIVAGGETAGAVVKALNIHALRIGPEIDPGVPWTIPVSDIPMLLALKSGNFGSDDFFIKALAMTT